MTYLKEGRAVIVPISSRSMLRPALQKRMRELVQAGASRILLDLAGLTDIDSAGVGQLVIVHISVIQAGGTVVLIHVPNPLRELLRFSGLCDVFTIQNEEAAIVPSQPSHRSEFYFG